MSSEVLVKVESVGKKFCRSLKRSLWYGMRDVFAELNPFHRNGVDDCSNPPLRTGEFWAVNSVSFELRRGECLGLIGRNGAGKTTLLKMLNGLIKPDTGRITMRGRVGALIALGAGFNPILTGRENIHINGSVLGLSKKEIDAKIEEIIDFAEIREFIDTPVQSYSSGMKVRLGFAVASSIRPEILIVDEVLAVGDVSFRSKCYDRIEKLKSNTATILVSHNRQDILRVCNRGLLLANGTVMFNSDVVETFIAYENSLSESGSFVHAHDGYQLIYARLKQEEIQWQDHIKASICLYAPRETTDLSFRMSIMDHTQTCVAEWRSEHHMSLLRLKAGRNEFCFDMGPIKLQSGTYFCNFIFSQPGTAQYLLLSFQGARLQVGGAMRGICSYQI